ncbi:ABC transporter ATP-binding protein [Ovoidimarina sediminis]|uniref:ABC transporter ATP-binding protein n=1 Tax=Ovoidimarina sediminis TaxID=3079856 RepID=UPI002913A324|nr:ABC transporter ATP-binding protein [Rhodophyticola sp. MJ-SS7]MDU8945261.1 ABC transporter ATP-binding protein [Rhodophyticola sp. MJ-SS7]
MTALLELRDVRCDFGAVRAVDSVSLDIAENEFFALLGASGSGKTTLLRMLAGFQKPTSGAILLDGKDISPLPPERRPVNLMFQSYALFPHMSVRQNVSYGLEMDRLPKAEIAARVGEILETVQLSDLAERKPEQLSGGQRQRVALARALVKRPRLLLLDEPLGALDKKLRGAMQLELKRLQHEVGITFIVVTHDQEEALVMADRIAILDKGRLVQCGPPREIYERPATRFAADFIGTMNFLPISANSGGLTLATGEPLKSNEPAPNGPSVAAIRPERLRLHEAGDDNRLDGTVRARAYHGLDLQIHVETAAAPDPVIVRITADVADRITLAIGDPITLGWSARDTRIFET